MYVHQSLNIGARIYAVLPPHIWPVCTVCRTHSQQSYDSFPPIRLLIGGNKSYILRTPPNHWIWLKQVRVYMPVLPPHICPSSTVQMTSFWQVYALLSTNSHLIYFHWNGWDLCAYIWRTWLCAAYIGCIHGISLNIGACVYTVRPPHTCPTSTVYMTYF